MRCFVVCALLVAGCAGDGVSDLTIEGSTLTTDEEVPVSFTIEVSDPSAAGNAGATKPEHGTVTVDGLVVTYTPDKDYVGPDAFDIYVGDGAPPSPNARVDVTVRPVNDAPLATNDRFAATEDVAFTQPFTMFLANDVDVDGDALTITAVGAATNGTVSIVGNEISFVAAANFAGSASFEYTMSDSTTSSTATVTLDVGLENDAPVVTDDAATAVEDTELQIPIATLLANDIELDGQTITFSGVVSSTNCATAVVAGVLYVTPQPNFYGAASVEYSITDGTETSSGIVAITVTAQNDAPVAVSDAIAIAEDATTSISPATLLGNDNDIDSGGLTITSVANDINGTVSFDGTSITFVPSPDFHGFASFEYTVSDGQLTSTATVNVAITAAYDPPRVRQDNLPGVEDTTMQIPIAQLLANDTSPDGLPLTVTRVELWNDGDTVSLSNGVVTYTPALNVNGWNGFSYYVSDGTTEVWGFGGVTVAPVNDGPAAYDDSFQMKTNTELKFTELDLAANDIDVDTARSRLYASSFANATNCTVGLSVGWFTVTTPPNFVGTASFDYTISDGDKTATAAVYINVTN